MPNSELQPGLAFRQSIVVDRSFIGSSFAHSFIGLASMPPVFATAAMAGLVESTCVDGLSPYLLEGEYTVGTLIDLSHVAATPIGMTVTAEARLLAVVGRKLRFVVTCRDGYEIVGKGCHERTLIHAASFLQKVDAKKVRLT